MRLCAVVGMCPAARCTPDLNFKALPRTPYETNECTSTPYFLLFPSYLFHCPPRSSPWTSKGNVAATQIQKKIRKKKNNQKTKERIVSGYISRSHLTHSPLGSYWRRSTKEPRKQHPGQSKTSRSWLLETVRIRSRLGLVWGGRVLFELFTMIA